MSNSFHDAFKAAGEEYAAHLEKRKEEKRDPEKARHQAAQDFARTIEAQLRARATSLSQLDNNPDHS